MTSADLDLLPVWLAKISTGARNREAAIRASAETLSSGDSRELLDLVLLAHGRPIAEAADRVRDAVRAGDPSFAGRPGDAQTQVVAAWAVATVLSGKDEDRACLAALATASAAFRSLQTRAHGLATLAANRTHDLSEEQRGRHALPKAIGLPKQLADFAFDPTAGGPTPDQHSDLVDAMQAAFRTLAGRVDRLRNAATNRLDAADEEIDVLWWTVRGRRDGTSATWRVLGSSAPILAGLDLARLMRFTSPIGSSASLLAHALDKVKPSSLDAAIAAAAPLAIDLNETRHELAPVTSAVALARDATDWRDHASSLGLDLAQTVPAADLAEQVLREVLLRRVM